MTRITPLALLVSVLLAVAGCGGNGDADVALPDEGASNGEALQERAQELERILEEEVRQLDDVRSPEDLSTELEDAQSRLEDEAAQIEEAEVREDLEDERRDLADAARALRDELADVRREVDANDLRGALEELRTLDEVERLERAIERARSSS